MFVCLNVESKERNRSVKEKVYGGILEPKEQGQKKKKTSKFIDKLKILRTKQNTKKYKKKKN